MDRTRTNGVSRNRGDEPRESEYREASVGAADGEREEGIGKRANVLYECGWHEEFSQRRWKRVASTRSARGFRGYFDRVGVGDGRCERGVLRE